MASREEAGGSGGAPKLSSSVKLVLLGEAAVGKVGSPHSLATLVVAACAEHPNMLGTRPPDEPGKIKGSKLDR